jgi:hypothetical protein
MRASLHFAYGSLASFQGKSAEVRFSPNRRHPVALPQPARWAKLGNPFGVDLCRLNIAIQQGNRRQVGRL